MRRRASLALACLVSLWVTPASAAPDVMQFIAQNGCAIGPRVYATAGAQGILTEHIDQVKADMLAHSDARLVGDWVILSPNSCTVELPQIDSVIGMDDPAFVQNLSAIDAYADEGQQGCFLDGQGMQASLQSARGWTAEQAFTEYMRFIGAGLVSGDMRFYSPSPLQTPVGFQRVTGACADVENMAEIETSAVMLDRYFDSFLRAHASETPCGGASAFFDTNPTQRFHDMTQGKNPNAWIGLEVFFIAQAAGWVTGAGLRDKGQLTPPLCHFISD